MSGLAGVHPHQPKRIVFVCVENSCRSQMAEAFLNILSAGRIEAYSAGSRPSRRINPKAIQFMRERGYDLGQHEHRSKALSELPPGEYDVAVMMGCGDQCPNIQAKRRESWDIPDPKDMPPDQFRAVRAQIEEKVKDLLARL